MKANRFFRRALLTMSLTLIFLGAFTTFGDTMTTILTTAFGPACTYSPVQSVQHPRG